MGKARLCVRCQDLHLRRQAWREKGMPPMRHAPRSPFHRKCNDNVDDTLISYRFRKVKSLTQLDCDASDQPDSLQNAARGVTGRPHAAAAGGWRSAGRCASCHRSSCTAPILPCHEPRCDSCVCPALRWHCCGSRRRQQAHDVCLALRESWRCGRHALCAEGEQGKIWRPDHPLPGVDAAKVVAATRLPHSFLPPPPPFAATFPVCS